MRVGTGDAAVMVNAQQLAVLGPGSEIELAGLTPGPDARASRAIVVAGRPLREPVAKYGPFVMNTREEVLQAFEDFQSGRF